MQLSYKALDGPLEGEWFKMRHRDVHEVVTLERRGVQGTYAIVPGWGLRFVGDELEDDDKGAG